MNSCECPLCRGKMIAGSTELTMRRGRSVVVIEEVPALICQNCGEASIEASVSQKSYKLAESEILRGVSLEFCKFKAA